MRGVGPSERERRAVSEVFQSNDPNDIEPDLDVAPEAARHRAVRGHRRPVPAQAAPGPAAPVPGRAGARLPHRRHVARRPRRRRLPQVRPPGLRRVRQPRRSPRTSGRASSASCATWRRPAAPPASPTRWPQAEDELGGEPRRLHYLSIPPGAARAVVRTLGEAELVDRSRIIMEKPFGTDLRQREGAQRRAPRDLRRGPDLPDRPLPRQGGGPEHPRLPLRQRAVRADLEPRPHRPRADRRARDAGARHPGRLLRDDRGATATWSSPTCSRCWPSWPWSRRPRSSPRAISEEKNKVFRSMRPIEPAQRRARPVRRLPRRARAWPRLRDRDLRRPEVRDRQLALGRRAVLPADGQAHGRGGAHHLHRLPRAAEEHVPGRLRRGRPRPRPPHLRPGRRVEAVAVVLRQASGPGHEARQAEPAVRPARDRTGPTCSRPTSGSSTTP